MEQLDLTGLKCPLSIFKVRRAMKGLASGDRLCLRATDPGFPSDLQEYCRLNGHRLEQAESTAGEYRYVIEKS